ncbi:hypothetical protein DVH24_005031 [Malus domestica]|uniref:Uncharacterized protein n=1 Tax=Malus domestica TaxID=3750 RepID=A0A498IGJ8_MALDO|nr:hypothetical protein DVH24_005031 [Malus domestica]
MISMSIKRTAFSTVVDLTSTAPQKHPYPGRAAACKSGRGHTDQHENSDSRVGCVIQLILRRNEEGVQNVEQGEQRTEGVGKRAEVVYQSVGVVVVEPNSCEFKSFTVTFRSADTAGREVEDELESGERIVGPGQGELLPQIVKHVGVILLLRLLLLLAVIAGSLCDVEKQIEAGVAVRLKNLVILVIFNLVMLVIFNLVMLVIFLPPNLHIHDKEVSGCSCRNSSRRQTPLRRRRRRRQEHWLFIDLNHHVSQTLTLIQIQPKVAGKWLEFGR